MSLDTLTRNPWGSHVEWRGSWCDGSRDWELLEEGEAERVGLHFDADGEWWMTFRDFVKHFDQIEICHLMHGWEVNTWHDQWRQGISAGGSRYQLLI